MRHTDWQPIDTAPAPRFEMCDAGVDDLAIAAAMNAKTGQLYRTAFPNDRERRAVILQAAEVAITGQPQELRI